MGEQQVVLKDHADPAPAKWFLDPTGCVEQHGFTEPDMSSIGPEQAGDQPEDRGFPRTRLAKEDANLRAQTHGDINSQSFMNGSDQVKLEHRGDLSTSPVCGPAVFAAPTRGP